MLVIRRLFGSGTNCIAPSGLPLLLCLFPGLAPWAFLSRPCGASFAPETSYSKAETHEPYQGIRGIRGIQGIQNKRHGRLGWMNFSRYELAPFHSLDSS